MDFQLTEAQQMLKTSARDFLHQECPATFIREMETHTWGYTGELWRRLAEMGWLGLTFPEEHGGIGEDFVSLCILVEETGRALLPGPFLSTVLASLPIAAHGTGAQRQALLPRIADGETVLSHALDEDPAETPFRATPDGNTFVLSGAQAFVPWAHAATLLLVSARTNQGDGADGLTLFLVPADAEGVSRELHWSVSPDRQGEVRLDGVRLSREDVLGQVDQGYPVLERLIHEATVASCADMLGQAQMALEMTVQYAGQRIQFDKPIGTFQAIQHHVANMAADLEAARALTYQAAWHLARDLPAAELAAAAKAWAGDAVRRVMSTAHQCHGAIGFTREYDLQLYTRRAKSLEGAFGDSAFHREQVARLLGM